MNQLIDNPLIAGTVGSILAAIIIYISLIAWNKYKNQYIFGLNISRSIIFTAITIISLMASFLVHNFYFDSYYQIFTHVIPINSFAIGWLLIFLLLVMLAIIIPNWLKQYDVFLSVPMSFEDEDEYHNIRNNCLELIELLKNSCGFKKIYCAAEKIESTGEFNPGQNAVILDLEALRRSKRFILYMPRKVHTSAIFDCWLCFKKKSTNSLSMP